MPKKLSLQKPIVIELRWRANAFIAQCLFGDDFNPISITFDRTGIVRGEDFGHGSGDISFLRAGRSYLLYGRGPTKGPVDVFRTGRIVETHVRSSLKQRNSLLLKELAQQKPTEVGLTFCVIAEEPTSDWINIAGTSVPPVMKQHLPPARSWLWADIDEVVEMMCEQFEAPKLRDTFRELLLYAPLAKRMLKELQTVSEGRDVILAARNAGYPVRL